MLLSYTQDTKQFDGWSLKQSILNTLLQAVKAIAGGVTTLKGQLIKGSGYLVTQKGKVRTNFKLTSSMKRKCLIIVSFIDSSFNLAGTQSQMLERTSLLMHISLNLIKDMGMNFCILIDS